MRWTFLFSGLLEGIWMLIDGFQLLSGSPDRFSSGELWNRLVRWLGIEPDRLGPLFLLLGTLWIFVTIAVVKNLRHARSGARILGIASLWYAIPGTVLALIYIYTLGTLRSGHVEAGS